MTEAPDILVVGGGPVGTALALALSDAGFSVTLMEARNAGEPRRDRRTLALSAGSQQLLQKLKVWPALEAQATPIRTVHVSQRGGLGRTVFRASDLGQEALGYVLPYTVLADTLEQALAHAPGVRTWYGTQATAVAPGDPLATVHFKREGADQAQEAALVVLADGGQSLGSIPGMHRILHDYQQSAVVGFVESDRPHDYVAYERFTPQGPVALLPAHGQHFAFVWTAPPAQAAALCAMDDVTFLQVLSAHFGGRAGAFRSISGRTSFPLQSSRTLPVTVPHLVVVGNAAQTLHPIAGQGFNLGLRDAWTLVRVLSRTSREDLGSKEMLELYRQWRQRDAGFGLRFTDFLVHVFSATLPGLGLVRGAGLAALELLPPARRLMARRMGFGVRG